MDETLARFTQPGDEALENGRVYRSDCQGESRALLWTVFSTILHLLGLDHQQMIHSNAETEYRLIDDKPCGIVGDVFENPLQV